MYQTKYHVTVKPRHNHMHYNLKVSSMSLVFVIKLNLLDL